MKKTSWISVCVFFGVLLCCLYSITIGSMGRTVYLPTNLPWISTKWYQNIPYMDPMGYWNSIVWGNILWKKFWTNVFRKFWTNATKVTKPQGVEALDWWREKTSHGKVWRSLFVKMVWFRIGCWNERTLWEKGHDIFTWQQWIPWRTCVI